MTTLRSSLLALVAIAVVGAWPAIAPADKEVPRSKQRTGARRTVEVSVASADGVLPSIATHPELPALPAPVAHPGRHTGTSRSAPVASRGTPGDGLDLRAALSLVAAMPTAAPSPFADPLTASPHRSSPGDTTTVQGTRPPSLVRDHVAPVSLGALPSFGGYGGYHCNQHMLGCMRRRPRRLYCTTQARWASSARPDLDDPVPYTVYAQLCDAAAQCPHVAGTRLRVRIDPRTLRHDVAIAATPAGQDVSALQALRSCAERLYARERFRPHDLPAVEVTVRLGRPPAGAMDAE